MKKIILTLAALVVSGSVFAEALPKPSDLGFKYKFTVGASTMDSALPKNLLDSKVRPNAKLQVALNSNVYVSGSLALDDKYRPMFGVTAGVTVDAGLLRPYVELNTTIRENRVKNYIEEVGYDMGLTLWLNPKIQPYIEVKQFADDDMRSLEVGATYLVSKTVGVKGGVSYGPGKKWHSINMAMNYNF